MRIVLQEISSLLSDQNKNNQKVGRESFLQYVGKIFRKTNVSGGIERDWHKMGEFRQLILPHYTCFHHFLKETVFSNGLCSVKILAAKISSNVEYMI